MGFQGNTSYGGGSTSSDGEPILERLRANAQRIEQAQNKLQAIARTIDETRSVMRQDEPVGNSPHERLRSKFGAQAEAMLERVACELIGIPAHAPRSKLQTSPTARQPEAPRRPGRYRQLV